MSLVQRIADLATRIGVEVKKKVNSTDARLSDARDWVALEVPQVEAEAGSSTTLRKWSALRVRQAWTAAWNALTGIDGKPIGNTTRSTIKCTTLDANSTFNLGGAGTSNAVVGMLSVTNNSTGGGCIAAGRSASATSGHSSVGVGATLRISTEGSITGYEIAGNFVTYPAVKPGYTQGGYTKGAEMSVLRNIVSLGYDDNGTLATMQGLSIAVGHYNTSGSAAPITMTCSGISLTPYCLTGSIINLFGLNIGAISGPTNVSAASALKLGFAAAANHKNLDCSGTAFNKLVGNTAIGEEPTSAAKLSVAGPMRWGQYTLSTLPSAAAYPGCHIDVVDAAGGPTECRSNGSTWNILNTTTPVS